MTAKQESKILRLIQDNNILWFCDLVFMLHDRKAIGLSNAVFHNVMHFSKIIDSRRYKQTDEEEGIS